ncbi:MAG: Na+/H+ antiporter NhaC family protein, partial [Halanaerobium sp.]
MELSFKQAIIPVITMALLIIMSVLVWNVPIQIALFFEIIIITCLAFYWGYGWNKIEKMMFSSFKNIGNVILILFLIGMMIGLWIAIGTVPTMISYGLKTINPEYFLVLSFISTSLVSMAIGTAVGTASTIGLALISIAETLGMSLPLAAGAIISGAYVGDRMSPVSSIANITAHSAEADILDMVKSMVKTTVLPYITAGIIYLIIGLNLGEIGEAAGGFNELITALDSYFMISGWMLLPPILIITLAFLKTPTILNL